MNKGQKGQRKERKARKELEKKGFKIIFKSIRTRAGLTDYANLFDIVAYRGKERKFISVKHFGKNNYYLPHQQEIRKFKQKHGLDSESYELWLWVNPRWTGRDPNKIWEKGHWKIIEINKVKK